MATGWEPVKILVILTVISMHQAEGGRGVKTPWEWAQKRENRVGEYRQLLQAVSVGAVAGRECVLKMGEMIAFVHRQEWNRRWGAH